MLAASCTQWESEARSCAFITWPLLCLHTCHTAICRLIPRAGAGPKLRQSGNQIDEYLMRLLRVGAANEAEARLYAQVSKAISASRQLIVSMATQQLMFRVVSLSAGVTLECCTS